MATKNIWVDGACSTNGTWAGGYGVCWLDNNQLNYVYSEHCNNTTNNREELKAVIHALSIIDNDKEDNEYIINTDSAYVRNMCTVWIWGWAKNNWQNSKKKTVENLDLVIKLYDYLIKNFDKCQFNKVDGHSGLLGNEIADALATNNKKKLDDLIYKYDIAFLDIFEEE